MRFENTWREIRDHSFIQNHSRPFRFTDPWRCFFSSLTHLLQGSGQRTPDERSETFLHPESLQILQIHRSMTVLLQFTHSSSTGFRSEDWDGRSRSLVLCSVTHVCVVCVWIIVRLEDPSVAHYNISNRDSHLLISFCWYLIESMMPCV